MTRHAFGELLASYRARKPGLTQTRLAELAGYDQAILVRMAQGKKDLTGPSGRERVVRLIETLADQGVLSTLDEANSLLTAADMSPLFEKQPIEARLIARLAQAPAKHRVRRTNLPAPLTGFIGRTEEIAQVRLLLGETRLLTLTGAGGCGKTRLAQRVAADVLITYADGVWYAELAVLTDPTLVADTVAHAIGLIASDQPAFDHLADYMSQRQALIVLDNCEHLIEGVAAFALALLRACPGVSMLTTSRENLNVEGETTWRVPPMHPDEASRLFVERAFAIRNDMVLGTGDLTVRHICARLDGMPLAIELAASRLSALSLSDIAARLDDRFGLLAHGKRGALPRHQTLRALIDWSYELLSEAEKVLFRRLGVFVGGWNLSQAGQVVAMETDVETLDVESLLTQLVAKSLVTVNVNQDGNYFHYLETIREYANEKLAASGEVPAVRDRHAQVFASQVGISAKIIDGHDQKIKLDRLERDYGNFESALEWSFDSGYPLDGCRLVCGLVSFWSMRTRWDKHARRWVQVAKQALADGMPLQVQAGVWMAVTVFLSSGSTALDDARQVLRLYELAEDREGMALGKCRVGQCLFWSGHKVEGERFLQESLALARRIGEAAAWLVRLDLYCLGGFADHKGNLDQAESYYQEGLRHYQVVGDMSGIGDTLFALSGLAVSRLQFGIALNLAEEGLSASRRLEDVFMEARMQFRLADIQRLMGNCHQAEIHADEALMLARENGDDLLCACAMIVAAKTNLCSESPDDNTLALFRDSLELLSRRAGIQNEWGVEAVAGLVWYASRSLQWMRSAHLIGIKEMLQSGFPSRRPSPMDIDIGPCVVNARAALGDDAYEVAYLEGRAMARDQAVAYTLMMQQDPVERSAGTRSGG